MRFTVVIFLVLGLTCSAVLGRAGKRRVLRVRKTGEFGRRIPAISQSYEPPKRGLDQFLHTSESRTLDNVIGIRRPSQSLELPAFSIPEQDDSVAAETGESPRGYAYPNPSQGGYDFSPMKMRPPVNPIAEYPETDQGEQQGIDEPPRPVQPEKEAAFFGNPKPFGAETDSQIDAADQTPIPPAPPTPVSDSPAAEAHCDENDPNCWPHGYEGVIPGIAGQDYPVLSEIVDTPFDCENVQYSGYYADSDAEARCQIFHVCLKGNAYRKTQKWSFLCPNGTVFSQGDFVCVWWDNAPECNNELVGELSLRNAELGWDNLTEEETRSAVGAGLNGKMSSNIQASGSNSRSKNIRPTETTKRPPTQQQSSRNSIPYRVPVKENARTKLKEVAGNGIREQEYTGQESETFETSLRHQSEARHRSKTASALRKSESEAYEQKSVPESVAPFVINRGPTVDDDNDGQHLQTVERGEYSEEEPVPKVVMMPTQKKNPDGSGSYAEVPVMMGSSGYRYPNPTSTPGPEYLPPRKESYSSPSTTEASPTTTTFLPSATEESVAADDGGYQYQTTQTSSFSAQLKETTTEQGYNYPTPTTTEQGYNYPVPTTTDAARGQYNYPSQTTTTTDVSYQEDGVSSEPLSVEGGYEYETSTASVDTTTNNNNNAVVPSTTTVPEGGYLPPNNDESTSTGYPRSSAALQNTPDVLSLQNSGYDSTGQPELENSKVELSSTVGPQQTEDFTEISELSTTGGNSVGESGGYEDKSILPEFNIPTSTSAANLADNQENVNRILQEIQNGGAEVRDENGNKLDFEELQKLIQSTPNGLLSLQKADESVTTDVPTSNFPVTEVPSENRQEQEQEVTTITQEPQPQVPQLETLQTIEETPSQRYLPQPQPQYQQQQQQISNNNYFSNNQFGSITRPGYEISTPSKEYESHILQQNSIESSPNPFSAFSSFQTERQPQTQTQPNLISNNYYTPQSQPQQQAVFQQNFASVQNTQGPQVYFQQPQSSQAPQVQHQSLQQFQQHFVPRLQEPVATPEVNFAQTNNQQTNQQYFPQNQIPQQYNSHSEPAFSQSSRIAPSVTNSHSQLYYQTQTQPKTQDQFVQQQKQQQQRQSSTEYLPPPSSTSNSQLFSTNPSPIQFRNNIVPSTPTRNLNNDIELQRSYSVQMPQASTNSRQQIGKPLDIKIVPALLVNTHTRVEHQNNRNAENEIANLNGNSNQQQRQFSNNQNTYLPYPTQTQNDVDVTGRRGPRLNPFRLEDALPRLEKFTPDESRSAEQVMQYNNLRRSGGGRDYQNMPSNEQTSNNKYYSGRDNSLGVRLTYN